MKKITAFLAVLMMIILLAACGGQGGVTGTADSEQAAGTTNPAGSQEGAVPEPGNGDKGSDEKRVARDGADIQSDDPSMPTRVLETGTRINMHFGDTIIPGILNDSETARALIDKLPYTVHMNSYSHDFCGVTEELPFKEEEVHYGWLNGDIDYAIDAPYFTILHSDEDDSEQYGYQVNIGVITCELSKIRDLEGSYDVLIELAE